MSLISGDPEHSPRDCSRAARTKQQQRRRGALIIAASVASSSLVAVIILWLWLTALRPSSPRFSLLAATVTVTTAADSSSSSSSNIIVDAAVSAHNPNAHATALYDQLRASASYAGVPLGGGARLMLPPLLEQQPDQGEAVLSALLTSTSPSWRSGGGRAAALLLRVRIEGQLRWKVAAWVSGRHGLTVDCVAAVVAVPSPSSSAGTSQQGQLGSSSSFPSQCATHIE